MDLRRGGTRWIARLLRTLGALWLLLAGCASAGDLQVAPTVLEFGDGQHAQALWLTNSGTAPLRAQVRVRHWNQHDAAEQLLASDALLASPAIVEIAAGQRQLVRIVRAQSTSVDREDAFRLIVDELPGAAPGRSHSGLKFLLRYSIPVFVLPPGFTPQLERDAPTATHPAQLHGQLRRRDGAAELTLHNVGQQRIRISQLIWLEPSGQQVALTPGLLGYVLAGQRMRWNLPLSRPLTAGGTLQAKLNDDPDPRPLPQLDTEH